MKKKTPAQALGPRASTGQTPLHPKKSSSAVPGSARQNAREVDRFLQRVSKEFDSLSQALQLIARYVESHRDQLALQRVQDVAHHAQVQPSAVVRFAKHFGFSGYTAMRHLFRAEMSAQINLNTNYQARIRDLLLQSDHPMSSAEISQTYIAGAISGMQSLQQQLAHTADLDAAVELLAQAASIWIAGTNRAFPVASYLAYALQHTDKPVHWVAAIGAMHSGELRAMRQEDVLIAISFAPYGEQTLATTQAAVARGAKVLALTDSLLSPLAKLAQVSIAIPESSVYGFRSLTNTLVVAQSVFVSLAYRLEIRAQTQPIANTATSSGTR